MKAEAGPGDPGLRHTWSPAVLERMIAPKSIALVGASETSFFGRIVIENLQKFGYQGRVFPVNPNRSEILGLKCYPSLEALPCAPDHALLAIAADAILPSLETCHAMGAGGATVITAGFGETHTSHGIALEQQLIDFSRDKRFPFLGPNCLSLINAFESCYPFGSAMAGKLMPGNIGVTMQSGGMIGGLLRSSYQRLGYGYCVSTGNEAGLETSDWMRYMIEDPRIEVICAYIEGFRTPAKFLEVARLALEREKPLLVLKVGRTEAGRQAALAHTGSLAGSDQVVNGLFHEYGITRVSDFDEMIETAALFSRIRNNRPRGFGFAAVTASGGTRSMIADMAGAHEVELPEFSPDTVTRIRDALPGYATVSNPLDATAQVLTDTDVYRKVIAALVDDPRIHLITVFQTLGLPGEDMPFHVRLLNVALEEMSSSPKPVTVAAVSAQSLSAWQRQFLSDNPELAFTQGLVETLRAGRSLMMYQHRLEHFKAHGVSRGLPAPPSFTWRWGASPARGETGLQVVTEHAGKAALQAYGIGVTREELVHDAAGAAAAASRIGFPVALKYISPDVLHKSDAGGVLLNMNSEEEVRAGYERLRQRVKAHAGADVREEGVLVQEMIAGGVEVILGVVNDAQFGPSVMVGIGGIFVEVLNDVVFAPAPVQRDDAAELIQKLKGRAMLGGARGRGPYDVDALVDAIVALSLLAWEAQDVIDQIDINPLMVMPRGAGIKALDALFILRNRVRK